MSIFRAQESECAQHPRAMISGLGVLTVKALDQQPITITDGCEFVLSRLDSAAAGEFQHDLLNSGMIPIVIEAIELRYPERIVILDDDLGTGPAHRRSPNHKLLCLLGIRVLRQFFLCYDRIDEWLELFKLHRAVKFSFWRRWFLIETKTESTRTVVRRVKQVIRLIRAWRAELSLDNSSAPMIGARITKCAQDSFEQSCLIGSGCELEFDWVYRYCVLPGKVTFTVHETTRRDTVTIDIALETPRRDKFRFAR